jgi:hypothetical protein
MVAIPFPTTSAPGKRPHESAGRLINVYREPLIAGARGKNVWRRAPGLKQWAATSQSGFRGALQVGATLYAAWSGIVRRFDSGGVETAVGGLAGTRKVFFARNNKATPDVVAVDPDNGAFVITASSVTAYPDADLPQACDVCQIDGYFFFAIGDGRCFATAINDTAINALTFTTSQGKPGGLLRCVPWSDLYLCGPHHIEVYHDTAEPPPGFPFSRVTLIPRGLIGRYAISGYEDGIGKGLVFVGDDGVVYALNGYQPAKISTPDVDRAIRGWLDAGGQGDDFELSPYVVGGHSCLKLRWPAATWIFDLDTTDWFERQSYGLATWRAVGGFFAFGKWLAGDSQSGALVEITERAVDEAGSPLIARIESGPVSAFPGRAAVTQATFEIAQGVGVATGADPIATDPALEVSYSDDGGLSWSVPRICKLGRQQETPGPIRLSKTGMTKNQGRRWRLVVSDPVDFELTGGDMQAELRAG